MFELIHGMARTPEYHAWLLTPLKNRNGPCYVEVRLLMTEKGLISPMREEGDGESEDEGKTEDEDSDE